MQYTISEFAQLKNLSTENVRVLIHRNKLPNGFSYSREVKMIINQFADELKYIHPSQLTAEQRVNLENAHVQFAGNVKKISEATRIHYTTVYRFLKNDFKDIEASRADAGVSRKLSAEQCSVAHKSFDYWFCANAQQNVKLAIYKVKKDTGYTIPRRLADKWAAALLGVQTLKHYKKDFISQFTYHHRRDLWTEYANFMDCVVSDVWKIDDPYVNEQDKVKLDAELEVLKRKNIDSWERARTKSSTAYALVFMDVKTRYPVEVAICPHSVCGADVKKAMLSVIANWGDPKVWLLDNGKEFINKDTMDFLYGVYMGAIGEWAGDKREKKILLKEDAKLINSRPHHPQSKGMIEAAFKILKTQWAVYSKSYSPNQFESRKPGVALSSVQPTQSFEELALSLREFLYGDFIEAEREMFLNPGLAKSHPENKSRPKTIKEAFDYAYQSYEKKEIDQYLLAYHYADRRQVKFNRGEFCFTDPISLLKLHLIPEDYEAVSDYAGQKLTVLIDPKNIFHAWIFKEDRLLSEASDMRYDGTASLTKERAATLGKLERNIESIERKKLKKIEEYNSFKATAIVNEETKEETIVDESTGEILSDNYNSKETVEEFDPYDCLDADDLNIQ